MGQTIVDISVLGVVHGEAAGKGREDWSTFVRARQVYTCISAHYSELKFSYLPQG